jgi:hypothetical protein
MHQCIPVCPGAGLSIQAWSLKNRRILIVQAIPVNENLTKNRIKSIKRQPWRIRGKVAMTRMLSEDSDPGCRLSTSAIKTGISSLLKRFSHGEYFLKIVVSWF